jgi:glycosyltransferase 2 family protein
MSSRLKAYLKYLVILLITIFLVWFSLRSITVHEGENKWDYIVKTWEIADKNWLMIMAFFAISSHVVRSLRWKMLLESAGQQVRLSSSFLSLMVGYLVNLAIPRGGEVSRCYNLYKLDNAPVDVAFGTVVVERIVDLLCLCLLIILAFILESEKLLAFIETLPAHLSGASNKIELVLYGGIVSVFLLAVAFWIVRKNKKLRGLVVRTWHGMRSGLRSVFQLDNKGLFVFYSVSIWVFYFFMSYAVIKAFKATEHLGFSAMISLFGIGSIAMAAPLPGGTGSYHVLVPQGLSLLYNVPLKDAVALTFIFHGWQTLIMIVGGSLSLVLSSVLAKKI